MRRTTVIAILLTLSTLGVYAQMLDDDDFLYLITIPVVVMQSMFVPKVIDESIQFEPVPLRFGNPPSPYWPPGSPASGEKVPCVPGFVGC